MATWEYMVVALEDDNPAQAQRIELGQQRWELVTVAHISGERGWQFAYLKRQKS